MSQNQYLSVPDPEYAPILSTLKPPEVIDDLAAARVVEDTLPLQPLEARLPAASELRVEDFRIPVDGGEITIRCTVPTSGGANATFPVLVWYHSGGFVWGTLKQDDYRLRILCVEAQIATVNVEYRLAPEHPFPVPVDDGFAAAKWVVENPSLLSADLERGFMVGGASAGANLATIVAHRARNDPAFAKTPITGQILNCGPYLHPETTYPGYESELLSMEELKDDPILSRRILIQYARWAQAPKTAEGYSVIMRDHKGVAPVLMLTAGLDPLRDEQLLYAKLLEQAGVKTKVMMYSGLPHVFNYFFPQFSAVAKMEDDIREGINWLLSDEVRHE